MILTIAVCRKFYKTCRNISRTEVTVKEVTVFRVTTFFNEALLQIYFLGICEIFTITNQLTVKIWTAKCDFNKE